MCRSSALPRLAHLTGCPPFRQRLLCSGDHVQLVILDLLPPDAARDQAFLSACEAGRLEQVTASLVALQDPDAADARGATGLQFAARHGRRQVVRLLLEAQGDVAAADQEGWTALHLAADTGHADVVRLLLEARADLREGSNGETALHVAAYSGHAAVAPRF